MFREIKYNDNQITVVSLVFLLFAIIIMIKLFYLQVLNHDYYATLSLSTHEIQQKLYPVRGQILLEDSRSGDEYPAAVMKEYCVIYAVPKEISKENVEEMTEKISAILNFDEEEKENLRLKLSKEDDPYEPIAKKQEPVIVDQIESLGYEGIYFLGESYRYYPEGNLGSNLLGFYGLDEDVGWSGKYGLEGYWEKELAGKGGFLSGEKTAKGGWIALAGRDILEPENGVDLLLTIDRTLQYKACELLRKGFEEYQAKSASLVMMNPKTGAILVMCSLPDFDPNNYSKVDDIAVYNNNNIFTPYEPGSVFKPITMSIALDLDLVKPNSIFTDPCERKIDDFTVHNAQNKCYGTQTMTGVLENSINTGMIWVEEKIGHKRFLDHLEKFGFGKKTGVALNSEVAGDISSLKKKADIYGAVASFGQGITVTPLQLATAYSSLANLGQMPKPYIIKEIRYPDGRVEKTEEQIIDNTISSRASKLITGMLVSVIENGQGINAELDGYYIAGKTGTAQIAGPGGYTEETNHTFAGFAPADDPEIVLVVKYEAPQRNWSSTTAAPTFRDVMKFVLDYYGIPNTNK